MPVSTFKTLIVGTVRVHCDGLARLFRDDSVVRIVGVATCWSDAREQIRRTSVDAILLDASAGQFLSHVSAFRQACAALIVAFGVEGDAEIVACAQAGVNAICERGADAADLVAAIGRASRGELEISARATAALFRRAGIFADASSKRITATLTEREAEVLALLRQGRSNKEIASHLGVRPATIKNHVHNLLTKLGVSRRGEAIALPLHVPRTSERSRAESNLGHWI